MVYQHKIGSFYLIFFTNQLFFAIFITVSDFRVTKITSKISPIFYGFRL